MSDWMRDRGLGGYRYDPEEEPSGYMTAEVCLNGHATTDDVEQSPELTAKFCATCGTATIRVCPECKAPIRGRYHVPGVFRLFEFVAPNHCHSCGAAFPWTRARIEAAKEHAAEIDGLDASERQQLQGAIDDLASRGARTELGATRFMRLMKKAGQATQSGLYKVAIDVASETAKKLLQGG